MTEREPMDVRTLKKGDFIAPEMCEEMTGVRRTSRDYGLALLRLKQRLYDACSLEQIFLSFGVQKDGLKVHTDDEASNYHYKEAQHGINKMARSFRNMTSLVDRSMLTDGVRNEHDRNTALMAMRVQAVRGAGRAFALEMKKKQIEQKKNDSGEEDATAGE
jgi:hypothetical protein